jgi:hypothetical protein
MAQMPLYIDHDIAIVAVLNLQDVADKGVGRKTVAEIIPRFFVSIWFPCAKLLEEIVIECGVETNFLFDRMQTHRICY